MAATSSAVRAMRGRSIGRSASTRAGDAESRKTRSACKLHQPLGDGALRPMQADQKYTRRFANSVGDHRALLQLEIERSADELLRDLE